MKILLYRGKSWVSRLIQWQTRSVYSHAAIELEGGEVYEAWPAGGVRVVSNSGERHTPGTQVDVYEVHPPKNMDINPEAVRVWLKQQVGYGYDWFAVLRFLNRRSQPAPNRWFCSELVLFALNIGGVRLLNGKFSRMAPRDVAMSPYLNFLASYKTTREG